MKIWFVTGQARATFKEHCWTSRQRRRSFAHTRRRFRSPARCIRQMRCHITEMTRSAQIPLKMFVISRRKSPLDFVHAVFQFRSQCGKEPPPG